ncbi:MAG TPA: sialidase family protein [Roseiarcus sp.]
MVSATGSTVGSQAAAAEGKLTEDAVCCYTSTDGGKTWPDPVFLFTGPSIDNTFGAVDPNSGMVYAIWNSGGGTLGFAFSPDGMNWNASPIAQAKRTKFDLPIDGFNFVNISIAPDDGSVHIAGFNSQVTTLAYARSLDQGQTFSFGIIAVNQAGPLTLYVEPWLGTSPLFGPVNPPTIFAAGRGVIFVAWNVNVAPAASINSTAQIAIVACADGGAGWSAQTNATAPAVIPALPIGTLPSTSQDNYLMPRFAAMPNGAVGCLFMHLQIPQNAQSPAAQISIALSASQPDATAPEYFEANNTTTVVVTDQSTNPIPANNPINRFGNANGIFPGDFLGMAADGMGFYPYWSDTRSGSAQLLTSHLCPVSCTLIIDRSTFGEDEVTATLVNGKADFADAVYVVIDGMAPAQLGLTAANLNAAPGWLAFKGSFVGLPGVTLNFDGPILLEASDLSAIQRITIPYDIQFQTVQGELQAFVDVPSSSGEQDYQLFAELNANATQTYPAINTQSSIAEVELVLQADPYMMSGAQWWLSNDMRVFSVTPALLQLNQAPLTYSTTTFGAGPNAYIVNLLNELNTSFTDPTVANTPFNSISAGEDQSALVLSQNDANGNPVYNFGLARVTLRGDTAKNVRVFFRLFISPTPDTTFDQNTTFRSAPETGGSGTMAGTLIPLLGFPSNDMTSTIPFFAAPRGNSQSVSMTTQSDPSNVQTIPSPLIANPPAAGQRVYGYFGCWLDINQPTLQFPLNPSTASTPDGPWNPAKNANDQLYSIPAIIMSNHACLVAEIEFDPDPIPSGASASTSDKINQRNLSWVSSDNPGPLDAHRESFLFDLKRTGVAQTSSSLPDELMIDWGGLPAGSNATIFWPQIEAADVLSLAKRNYALSTLSKIDAHTIGCPASRITYLPIPAGTGPQIAGLITIVLPKGVRVGQQFDIVVRRLTARSVGRPSSNPMDLVAWRATVGAFQLRIPVERARVLLAQEEMNLRLYKLKLGQLPSKNRWRPVLRRYISQASARVQALKISARNA